MPESPDRDRPRPSLRGAAERVYGAMRLQNRWPTSTEMDDLEAALNHEMQRRQSQEPTRHCGCTTCNALRRTAQAPGEC